MYKERRLETTFSLWDIAKRDPAIRVSPFNNFHLLYYSCFFTVTTLDTDFADQIRHTTTIMTEVNSKAKYQKKQWFSGGAEGGRGGGRGGRGGNRGGPSRGGRGARGGGARGGGRGSFSGGGGGGGGYDGHGESSGEKKQHLGRYRENHLVSWGIDRFGEILSWTYKNRVCERLTNDDRLKCWCGEGSWLRLYRTRNEARKGNSWNT